MDASFPSTAYESSAISKRYWCRRRERCPRASLCAGACARLLPVDTTAPCGSSQQRCLKQLIAKNIEAEKPKADVNELASMVLTFFTGLSMEQNLKSSRAATGRKVDNLMQVLRSL